MVPPPPVTPSPHRFVIKKPPKHHPPHSSALSSSSQQFNATPRFSFASSKKSTVGNAFDLGAGQGLKQYATPARQAPTGGVLVEDDSDGADHGIRKSIESVEADEMHEYSSASAEDDYSLISPRPKRRRLSLSPDPNDHEFEVIADDLSPTHEETNQSDGQDEFEDLLLSSANTIASPPPETHHRDQHKPSNAPRFRLHPSHAATTFASTHASIPPSTPTAVVPSTGTGISTTPNPTPQTSTAPFHKPPRFRPPAHPSETAPSLVEPLPDAFSPQRRGQKFLTGGLAATVVGWVLNLEGSISASAGSRAAGARTALGGDEWAVVMVVEEVAGGAGGGMTLVSGRQVGQIYSAARLREGIDAGDGRGARAAGVTKIILAGSGTSDAFQRGSVVQVGKRVRIKQPTWEIVLDGSRWAVAVTWDVMG